MLNNKAITTALLISLSGHFLLFGLYGFNFFSPQIKKPQEIIVNIEIDKLPLLPKIDVMGKEKKLQDAIKNPEEIITRERELPKKLIKETVKIINPAQEAMLKYQDMVKQKIQESRQYPVWAKKQGYQGTTNLKFTILNTGHLGKITILNSSGHKILDEEACNTIKRSRPFPSIPKELNASSSEIEISIIFHLHLP